MPYDIATRHGDYVTAEAYGEETVINIDARASGQGCATAFLSKEQAEQLRDDLIQRYPLSEAGQPRFFVKNERYIFERRSAPDVQVAVSDTPENAVMLVERLNAAGC